MDGDNWRGTAPAGAVVSRTDAEAPADAGNLAAVSQLLEALRLAWGDVFMFGYENEQFWAARRDGPGTGVLRAVTPEELGHLCAVAFDAEANPS